MYLNRSLFKYELLYSNNTQIQGPQAEGQSFSLPSSYFPSLPLMGGQLLVFPSPLGLSFYKEKNTEFICVLRVMDSLLLLLGECTQTLWKRSVPAQLCPPLSLLIPPQQHPPSPAHTALVEPAVVAPGAPGGTVGPRGWHGLQPARHHGPVPPRHGHPSSGHTPGLETQTQGQAEGLRWQVHQPDSKGCDSPVR